MKTSFEKIDNRWVVNTGKVVAVDFINLGDDYDVILADQYKDVCTGETFAKQYDDVMSSVVDEPIYHLVKHYDEMPEYRHIRKNKKRAARAARINEMCGVHWTTLDSKRIGRNRRISRVMYPNSKQLAEFENELPF